MRDVECQAIRPTQRRGSAFGPLNPRDAASGWAVKAQFGSGGIRWSGTGPCLQVVAVNPQRGTNSSVVARLDLLHRAINATSVDGPCVYLTSAGFIGCVAPRGDRTKDFSWPGGLNLLDIDRRLGVLASTLPPDSLLAVGVEQSWKDSDQQIWLYSAGDRVRRGEIVRANSDMEHRQFVIGGFRLLFFVCGELWDGGSGFDMARNMEGVDVVLDAAHGSINRVRDRAAEPWPRNAFRRTFLHLGKVGGGILAQAHEVDAGNGYVRRQDNWVVYKGELPFPEVEVVTLQ